MGVFLIIILVSPPVFISEFDACKQTLHTSNQQLSAAQSSLAVLQVNISSLEALIDLSMKNKESMLLNQLKSDYVTATFQVLALITFFSSQVPEYYIMTRCFFAACVVLCVTGATVLKRGFYAIILSGGRPSRELMSGSDSLKRYVCTC